MRSVLLVLVVLAALGGLSWYLLGPESGDGEISYDEVGMEDGEEASGPGLTAAGSKRAAAADTSGAGWIQGTVTRGGEATASRIELRHVAEIDPRNPYGTAVEMQMIARMLDSGVSAKPILMKTRAGEDGRFRFKGLATGRYEVRATTETGAMGFSSASLPARGAHVEASIKIPVGDATLKGRVVYRDGTPFHGLVVATAGDSLAVMMGGGGDVRPTQTDVDGRFSFGGLVPGKTSISAVIPGRMRVMGPPVAVPQADEYLLTIDNTGNVVKGRVISAADESPISGATVFGGGGNPASSFAIRSTTTGVDGRFRLPIPEGRGSGVLVQAEGYAPSQMEKLANPEDELVIPLVAMGRITGRIVVKENGSPASGVTVFVKGGSSSGGMPNMSSTVTDADGRYAVGNVAPGLASLHALGSGWVSEGYSGEQKLDESPYAVEVEPGGSHELNLEVVPGAKAAGTLRTSAGEPVVGAVVHATTQRGMNDAFAAMFGLTASFGAVVTDEDGRFEIDVLAPGVSYHLAARAPDHPDATSEDFTAAAGKTQVVDLVMAAPRYLRVLVVAAEGGAPVSGARVLLQQGGGSGMGMNLAMIMGGEGPRTDKDGRARLGPVRAGDLKVNVSAPGYVSRKDISVEDDGGDALSVTIEVTRGLVIAGKVLVPTGVPAQSVRLTISRNFSNGGGWFHERPAVSSEGSFRVDTIEKPGLCQVKGELTWRDRTFKGELDVDPGTEDVRLELQEVEQEAAGILLVTIVDAGGKPVPSGKIRLRQVSDGGSHSSSRGFSAGRVTFRDIRPDAELWIEVHDVTGGRGAVVQGPLRPADGAVELRLPLAQTISGRVVGSDGAGVRGVRVSALSVVPGEGAPSGREHGKAVTNAEGDFTLKGLGELEYKLTFKAPPDFATPAEQTVRAGTKGVAVSLRAGLTATLTVVDAGGKPLQGAFANVTAQDSGRSGRFLGRGGAPRSDQDGKVRLRGLDPDAVFHLSVMPPKSREDLKSFTLEDWHPTDETIRLQRAWQIEGGVRDQKGRPAAQVWVRARVEGTEEWKHSANTDENGVFTFQALDDGRYEVRVTGLGGARAMPSARSPGSTSAEKDSVVVRAGTKGVTLTVDIGEKLIVRVLGVKRIEGYYRANASLRSTGTQAGVTIGGNWEGADRVVFKGLVPDTSYELWIAGIPGNAYVHKEAVAAQEEVLEVTTQAGLVLAGRVSLPAGFPRKRVTVVARSGKGFQVQAKSDLKTGQFKLEGLPPGPCSLHAYTWHDGEAIQGSLETTAGDTDIELALKKRP